MWYITIHKSIGTKIDSLQKSGSNIGIVGLVMAPLKINAPLYNNSRYVMNIFAKLFTGHCTRLVSLPCYYYCGRPIVYSLENSNIKFYVIIISIQTYLTLEKPSRFLQEFV